MTLIKSDHKQIRHALDQLTKADTPSRRCRALAQVEHELKAHTTMEEAIFYPAFRDAARTKKDRKIFFEAMEEHHAADVLLTEVGRADESSQEFAGRAKVLKETVLHHAEEEEQTMLPRARMLLSQPELRQLGEEMIERKRDVVRSYDGGTAISKVASMIASPFSS